MRLVGQIINPELQGKSPLYQLGNALRGYALGYFEDDDEAWSALAKVFDEAFPSRGGRSVEMTKVIRQGETAGGNESEVDRLDRLAVEDLLRRRQAARNSGPALHGTPS